MISHQKEQLGKCFNTLLVVAIDVEEVFMCFVPVFVFMRVKAGPERA